MTPPAPADRPRSPDGSTGPLPPVGGRLAHAPGAGDDSDDTGPVPIRGARPAPPSGPQPSVPVPVVPPPEAPADDTTSTVLDTADSGLPVTEQSPGRAGRNLPAAIAVGVSLV